MKKTLIILLTTSIILSVEAQAMKESEAIAHPLIHEGILTNPQEGLVLGNGDLGANVLVFSHELEINIGKNDVWDSRHSSMVTTEEVALTHDELIRHVEENGSVSKDFVFKAGKPEDPTIYYSPLRVCAIRIVHPGWSETRIQSKIEINRGVLQVDYKFPTGTLQISAFIHREKNLIVIRTSAEGKIPWFRLVIERDPGRWNESLPPLEVNKEPGAYTAMLSQTIPGRYQVDPFSWHVAAAFPDEEDLAAASEADKIVSEGVVSSKVRREGWSLKQDLVLQDGASLTFMAAVATDNEGKNPADERAWKMIEEARHSSYEEELSQHEKAWDIFWDASAIKIDDKELEALWYRGLYSFACHISPGGQAPGLAANIPITDRTAWHGKYTWNHNVQKWYFPGLQVNHPEWHDALAELLEEQMPAFRHLAKTIFGVEGVYCDLSGRPRETPTQAHTHPVVGRALCHTGWLADILYQQYKFTGDIQWLKTKAFPYIREAAIFYAAYMEKYQDDDLVIYPSMRLEDLWTERKLRAWGENFLGNKNVSTDLIYFRKTFEAAISSSEILGMDVDKKLYWSEMLQRVPEIDYGWRGNKAWYAICEDWEKAWPDFDAYRDHVRHSRWGCQAFPVFPGEYIDGDEEEGLAPVIRDIMKDVDLLNLRPRTTTLGAFHGEATVLPFIRMGMMEKFDDIRTLMLGHQYPSGQFSAWESRSGKYVRTPYLETWRLIENQYMQILGTTEMLLQSQGGIIRLFPYWPEDKNAAFHDLRAMGAFLVSAEYKPGSPIHASIHSLKGNQCRLRWREKSLPLIQRDGKAVAVQRDGNDLVFPTEPGAVYHLEANYPYSGGKGRAAEGGFRVPTIAWWPGTIPAGTRCDLMASTVDLLPTFAALSGKPYSEPADRPIDGHDLSDLFRGELPETSVRNTFVYYTDNTEPGAPPHPRRLSAVRQGKWKYYLTPQRFRLAGSEKTLEVPAGALFDLESDVAEALDVAGEHPRVVRKMKAFAEKTTAELGDGARMGAGVRKAAFIEHALPVNAGTGLDTMIVAADVVATDAELAKIDDSLLINSGHGHR